jgi:hypothetical protein
MRDALVRALRACKCEAEACERALRARRRAELQRQEKQEARAVDAARRLPLASRRRQARPRRSSF